MKPIRPILDVLAEILCYLLSGLIVGLIGCVILGMAMMIALAMLGGE